MEDGAQASHQSIRIDAPVEECQPCFSASPTSAKPAEEENMCCRMCLDDDETESMLFCPCKCQGTQRFVHRHCLERWRQQSDNPTAYYTCMTCNYKYNVHRIKVADFLETPVLPTVLTLLILCWSTACASRLATLLFEHMFFPHLKWVQSAVIGIAMQGFVALTLTWLKTSPVSFLNLIKETFARIWSSEETWLPGDVMAGLFALAFHLGLVAFPAIFIAMYALLKHLCKACLRKLSLRVLGDNNEVKDIRESVPQEYAGDSFPERQAPITRPCVVRGFGICALLTASVLFSYSLYSTGPRLTAAMNPNIMKISPQEFDEAIGNSHSPVTCVWFFSEESKADRSFLDSYNQVAEDLEGMVTLAAVNCNKWNKAFCDEKGIMKSPAVLLYPTSAPSFLYQGKMEAKPLENEISKLIPDMTIPLHSKAAIDKFLSTDRALRKVILFSNKKASPTILKTLAFDKSLMEVVKFGFASEADLKAVQRFKVKQFPTLLMIGEEKEEYQGEKTFAAIKQWLTARC